MPTIISTKNILDNANDFKYIAEKIVSDIDTKYKHYPVQFFVNGLLSIELYLKTIYFANNGDYPKNYKNKGIHSLIELFNIIPDVDQDKLKEKYSDIESVLSEYADGFIKFRYSYENFSLYGNQEKVMNLMKIFQDHCNNEYSEIIKKYFDSNQI